MSAKHVLDSRKEHLLKAIVKDYIHHASPVASLSLGGHSGLDVSTATLRNWMGELEELGFLEQPHTSAGRIPTDKGYRHYVDLLMETRNLSPKEKRMIARELEAGFHEIEGLLEEAAQIVSHIGGCTALALQPSTRELVLKRLELVQISKEKILLVLLTETGFVFDRIVEMGASKERLEALSRVLNKELKGAPLSGIGLHLLENAADEMMEILVTKILELVGEMVDQRNRERVLVEGTHLLLEQPEFQDIGKFRSALGLFSDEDRLSRFLGRVGSRASVHVFIGDENPLKDFSSFSVIAAPYGTRETGFGTLALVGPTRMEYDRLIPLVQFTASVLSHRLSNRLI